jgi:hydroxyacylglutathione hydrolase
LPDIEQMLEFDILPVTPFQQNCCLLWCTQTREAICTDPGGEVERIVAAIQERHLKLVKIVLTHGHLDHVGAAAELRRLTQAPIYGPHQEDQFWLDSLNQQAAMFQFPETEPLTPDRWLNEGLSIRFGEIQMEVRHCPGHTPGHIVLIEPEQKLAIVGDVLFKGSIGRTDFPKGDFDTLINSIQSKLFTLNGDVRIIPGHGPMSTIGHERETNPFVTDLSKG